MISRCSFGGGGGAHASAKITLYFGWSCCCWLLLVCVCSMRAGLLCCAAQKWSHKAPFIFPSWNELCERAAPADGVLLFKFRWVVLHDYSRAQKCLLFTALIMVPFCRKKIYCRARERPSEQINWPLIEILPFCVEDNSSGSLYGRRENC